MAHPTSISASQYSSLCVSSAAVPALPIDEATYKGLFADSANFDVIGNVREMPEFGSEPNIVKVPVYGQKTTSSIGAQSDSPDLNLTVNLVPGDWADGATLGDYIGDGIAKVWQFALLPAQAPNFETTTTGLGSVPNTLIYFVGKVESFKLGPSLTDATQGMIALSIQGDFSPLYTQDAA